MLNDISLLTWEPIPYFWFAFHWLAMSHSCYNPVIYCYMNARFRGGFVQILHCIPGVRRCFCVRQCARGRSGSIGTGFQLTGEKFDGLMPTDRLTRKPRIYIRCFIFQRCFSTTTKKKIVCQTLLLNMLLILLVVYWTANIFSIFTVQFSNFDSVNVRFFVSFASLLHEKFHHISLLMINH